MLFNQIKELRKLYGGFQAARVLITANNLGVFELLQNFRSADDIASALNADRRAVRLLLDALTGIGLLRKNKGLYKNTPIANNLLVKGRPYYQGNILRHMESLWRSWSHLDEVVKTGGPAPRSGGRNIEAFILGMHNLANMRVKQVLRAIGLKGVKTAFDLGGGPGTYAMGMAKKGVSVTLFDMPEAVEIARRLAAGVENMKFIGGNFLSDDIGRGYDLILISQIFHAYSAEDNMTVLGKCLQSLNPGGRVVIQEMPLNEARTGPPRSALFAINMLVNTPGGRCYSPGEMKGWLLETGLKNIRVKPLDDTVLVEGRRPL